MAALYEISQAYSQWLDKLYDPETPEEVAIEILDGIEGDMKDKAENIAALCLELEATADKIEEDERRQYKRRVAMRSKAEWLRRYLMQIMLATGNTKFETPRFRISVRNNQESLVVEDEKQVPRDYFREVPAKFEIDARLIKQAMKDGLAVPGCSLKRSQSLQIK